ncbi:MAG: hypothetical protein M3N42_01695, partial [Cyanobacteriota bacterium]|nr:hypothetical protein [Cyanobacteriota bacterium]
VPQRFLFKKYLYSHPYAKKNWFVSVEGRVYADSGRELKILINPPLGYLSPYKKIDRTAYKIPDRRICPEEMVN